MLSENKTKIWCTIIDISQYLNPKTGNYDQYIIFLTADICRLIYVSMSPLKAEKVELHELTVRHEKACNIVCFTKLGPVLVNDMQTPHPLKKSRFFGPKCYTMFCNE